MEATHQLPSLKQRHTVRFSQPHILSSVPPKPNQAPPTPTSSSPLPQWEDVDLEEQQLRQKLHEMTDNISDHSLSSDEEGSGRPEVETKPSRLPTRPASRSSITVSRLEEELPQQTHPEKVALKEQTSAEGDTVLCINISFKAREFIRNTHSAAHLDCCTFCTLTNSLAHETPYHLFWNPVQAHAGVINQATQPERLFFLCSHQSQIFWNAELAIKKLLLRGLSCSPRRFFPSKSHRATALRRAKTLWFSYITTTVLFKLHLPSPEFLKGHVTTHSSEVRTWLGPNL